MRRAHLSKSIIQMQLIIFIISIDKKLTKLTLLYFFLGELKHRKSIIVLLKYKIISIDKSPS